MVLSSVGLSFGTNLVFDKKQTERNIKYDTFLEVPRKTDAFPVS